MNDQDEKLLSRDIVDLQLLIRTFLIILIPISPF